MVIEFVVALASALAQVPQVAVDPAEVGAVVGAVAITRGELAAETDRHLPIRFHAGKSPAPLRAAEQQAFLALVEKALVFQDAQARGITASEDEIAAEFARTLAKAGPEYQGLADGERAALLERHRERVVRRILLDKNEARFRGEQPEVAAADVQSRYEARRSELSTPGSAHLLHILVKVPPDASRAQVDLLMQKARAARAEIAAGKPFAEVARAVSEDIYAGVGGDLGTVERGALRYQEIEAAAFALAPGQLSEVLDSMYGLHVVQCVEATPPRELTFAEAEPVLRERLAAERLAAARVEWHRQLRARFPVVVHASDWQEWNQ